MKIENPPLGEVPSIVATPTGSAGGDALLAVAVPAVMIVVVA